MPEHVDLQAGATCADLYNSVAKATGYPIYQLRITKGSDGLVLHNGKDVSVHSTGLRNESTVDVKDLGQQIAWRTVFIIEYFGPIFIWPLLYAIRPYVYPSAPEKASQMQELTMILVVAHFVKREIETILVHRFSAATMPIRNIFKNSAHYWILSGVNMAGWVLAPSSSAAGPTNPFLLYAGILFFAVGEYFNMQSHLTLRALRSSGGTERGIPQGFLFNLVTCPNYFTESLAWFGVYLASGFNWSVLVFIVAAVWQMKQWAVKKEKRYRAEFGDKYKKKHYTMIPGLF